MKLRVTVEGKVFDVDVDILEETGGTAPRAAAPLASSAPAPAAPAPAPAPKKAAPAAPAGGNVLPAPLAGVVRTIMVQPGDDVATDQELIVLEAMKMETPVSAASAGRIKAVLVNVGDSVQSGQPLLEFE